MFCFLCSSVICRFGDDNSRAGEVRAYFAPRKEVADFWIQYYVHCLMKDEPKNRLLRKEYERIYLDFNVMVSINSAILYICQSTHLYIVRTHLTYIVATFIHLSPFFYTLWHTIFIHCSVHLFVLGLSLSWCINHLEGRSWFIASSQSFS